ncbi:hypothetical protein [Lentzea sp. NPDC060358]|uniref:hypothetical protein n=1 Tax=Lentzea sp. NPDC060358 TaxID=3347103 RepID=UPI003648268A
MDDIDDELRRLFSDDRLDVHVTPDATDSVVAGASRRRRRRAAATGAFALVALIGAGVGLSQLRPLSLDSAEEVLPTSTSTATTTPPPPSISTYTQTVTVTVDPPPGTQNGNQDGATPSSSGRTGSTSTSPSKEGAPGVWGKLALGMSEEDALKTGSLTAPGGAVGSCKPYAMQSNVDPEAVLISQAKGIARIKLPSTAKTSKNIGIGSTVSDLKTAYPAAEQNGSDLVVQMTATPRWAYVFQNDGAVVTGVHMRLADHDCAGA